MTADIGKIVCGLVYAVAVIVSGASSVKLPKGFIQCKMNSPTFDACLKDAAQKAIPHLAKGVPSLGIVPSDPLKIPALVINQGTGPVNIKLNFKDLDILNIQTVVIDYIHFNQTNDDLNIELHPTKPIRLEGDYEISGKVLVLPIVGKGKCKISLELSKVVGLVKMEESHKKNGQRYMKISEILWKFTPTKLALKMDNLFNGDKALGDNMNVFLNENWRELIAELQPAIEDVFAVAFKDIGQQFLNRVPQNQIFQL